MTFLDTSVLSIEQLNKHVLKIVLDAKQSVNFKAGQYLQVVMGEKDKRPFSIANKPNNDHLLELHIGATEKNPYAFEVIEKARNTGALKVEAGLGDAYLRDSDKPAILIAGGTGYSYTKSILLDCLANQPKRQIDLYWGAKEPSDLYELDRLTQLATVHKHFNFNPVIEFPQASWTGKTGLVHKAVMEDFPSLSHKQVYVAGRFEMAALIKTEFTPLGLPLDAIFGDAFAFLK